MRKVTKFLMMAAIVFGFAACNNEEGPNVGTEGTGEKAWTTFSVALPNATSMGTRAEAGNVADANAKDTYVGTTNEQKVGTVRVVLYLNNKVEKAIDLTATTDGTAPFAGADVSDNNAKTVNQFTTVAQELTKAEYDVYVFLNAPAEVLTATAEGKDISELNNAATFAADQVMNANGFFMTNAKGAVKTTDANWAKTKQDAENETGVKPVKVAVERAVAKVFVDNKEINELPDGADAQVNKFAVNVTNKKLFWVRQLNKKVGGVDDESTAYPVSVEERFASYAKDPNMKGDPTLFAVATPTDLASEFNYMPEDATFTSLASNPLFPLKDAGFTDDNGIYVAENTMDAAEQYEVATTRVVFEIAYTPDETRFPLNSSYVEYLGMFFGPTEFQEKVNAYIADATQTDAALGMPVGFTAEIKALGTDTDFDFTNAGSFVKGNIKFYKDGINYYKTTIRHFTNDQEPTNMAYGRYGVVRNNIYKLSVNSIKGPGEPVIPQPDPEDPDDKEEKWIAVTVDVLPWIVRTQTVDL